MYVVQIQAIIWPLGSVIPYGFAFAVIHRVNEGWKGGQDKSSVCELRYACSPVESKIKPAEKRP